MYGQRVSRSFKDISLSFDPHPVTKDLPVLRNERAITRSVRNLVQTIPGERFFNPILGSGVRRLLFDFVDIATADSIEEKSQIAKKQISNIYLFDEKKAPAAALSKAPP